MDASSSRQGTTSAMLAGNNSSVTAEVVFNADNALSVGLYSTLFVISAIGNMTVFITLFRNRHRKSRVNVFIMHLSIADLITTLIMLPVEIGWHVTVSWQAGNFGCRFFMFFRVFGFYLSSFILIVISLDRYFAIMHPLSLNDAGRRGRIMLVIAWTLSIAASTPQSVIFHIERHPVHDWFEQCVTFNFFPSASHELAYNLFHISTVYVLPLIIILISYTLILCEINKKTRESKEDSRFSTGQNCVGYRMRRSGVGKIERARTRTLKMTIVIVSVFIMCWTPYFVISAWWWLDKESASNIDSKIQRGLFMFAVSNSCMNPLVYGFFALNFTQELRRCCGKFARPDGLYAAFHLSSKKSTSISFPGNTTKEMSLDIINQAQETTYHAIDTAGHTNCGLTRRWPNRSHDARLHEEIALMEYKCDHCNPSTPPPVKCGNYHSSQPETASLSKNCCILTQYESHKSHIINGVENERALYLPDKEILLFQ